MWNRQKNLFWFFPYAEVGPYQLLFMSFCKDSKSCCIKVTRALCSAISFLMGDWSTKDEYNTNTVIKSPTYKSSSYGLSNIQTFTDCKWKVVWMSWKLMSNLIFCSQIWMKEICAVVLFYVPKSQNVLATRKMTKVFWEKRAARYELYKYKTNHIYIRI